MIVLNGGIGARYSFETFGEAIKRLGKWNDENLVSEKEMCDFIIQMFHQIPEPIYNEIINEL